MNIITHVFHKNLLGTDIASYTMAVFQNSHTRSPNYTCLNRYLNQTLVKELLGTTSKDFADIRNIVNYLEFYESGLVGT